MDASQYKDYPSIQLRCKSCTLEFSFEEVVEEYIDELLTLESFVSTKDGGDSPYGTYAECNNETFIHA